MLQLKAIKKDYQTGGGSVVQALKGVDLHFRENEFVSILGPSGCGKTTLLNIIGGLDHYTSGDLVICGRSTKDYQDHDWDVYRNHRIGFVFQSYNLIPHQTVLGNVEIALTIAGVSKAERRKRAEEALARVGLSAELNKRPNQLSGGQMQRVAIARALVNNPEILLADEPTGALDTETSVQIMDLIREIAGERLVIMVTHNPELAEQYSTRIVKLQDGLVVADSNPYVVEESAEVVETENTEAQKNATPQRPKKDNAEKAAMSFGTSLGLSAQNLISKKGRTTMTSVAGSIGIISVCLVLALSSGFNGYIKKTEEDMLSYYPIEITETTLDMTAIASGMASASDMPDLSELGDKVYVNSFLTNIAQGMTVTNDLSQDYLDYLEATDPAWYTAIKYDTGVNLSNNLFTKVEIEGTDGQPTEAALSLSTLKAFYTQKLTEQEEKYANLAPLVDYLGSIYGKMPGTADFADEEYGKYVLSQYDLVGENSRFPQKSNEAVLVIGANNDVTDLTLAQLGFISEEEFLSLFPQGDAVVDDSEAYETLIDFNKVIGKKYMLNYNDAVYTAAADDAEYLYEYSGWREADELVQGAGVEIEITGILRLKEGRTYGCLESGLNFTEALYNEYVAANMQSEIAETLRRQGEANQQLNLLNNQLKEIPMNNPDGTPNAAYTAKAQEMLAFMLSNRKYFKRASQNLESYYIKSETTDGGARYILYGDTALRSVGGKDKVNSINIYTNNFEYKELLLDRLEAWNDSHDKSTQVSYTDKVGLMMSMMQTMLNAITYVLVAFTSISLVVSSVMIGIITYVSVVERVKEIGVLRSLGARKSDIKNLFNAETFIIGLASGVIGVAVSYLLCILVNAILKPLTGIATLASLPFGSALIMVVISVVLTLISGLIPAQSAANKDPVVALRTE